MFKDILNVEFMIEYDESFGDTILDLLKNNRDFLKLYGSYNMFYQKIINAHNLGIDLGFGMLINNKEIIHMHIYEYLLLSEGIFSKQIDMICFFLIINGNKFESKNKDEIKIIDELPQLQKESLIKKLVFLKDNGLHLFIKYFNTDLRNAIAHVDFDIDEEGKLIFKKQKLTNKDMYDINNNLLDLVICIHESLKRSYKNYTEELSAFSNSLNK